MTSQRRKARALALQTLFEIDLTGHSWGEVIGRRQEEADYPPETVEFATQLVAGTCRNRERLDDLIRAFATLWPVEQLSVVDRNVLRIAIFELLIDNSVPFRVCINEAVELAKVFGGEGSARFVNGVLGSIVREFAPRFQKEAKESGNSL